MTSVAKPTPTAVSFEFVLDWFERARGKADELGRSDSATLWADGIEHLKYMAAQKNRALTDLEHWRHEVGKLHSQRDTLKAEAAALKEQRDDLLSALQKISKASQDNADPELSSETSWGNYDDCFYDGKRQARYNCAVVARAAIAKAKSASESQKVVG